MALLPGHFPPRGPKSRPPSRHRTTHPNYLPPDTDPTVAAGYRAQMQSYAAALRGDGTAFYNAVLTGGASSGIVVDLHPLSRGTVNQPCEPAQRRAACGLPRPE
jgi:hypothetical protein